MKKIHVRSYLSPTLVLLAFDWEEGGDHRDFLGFAVKRTPGFGGPHADWLPNRIDFDGPAADGRDFPSNRAPIQKFMWWDARFSPDDAGKKLAYTVTPVVGEPKHLRLLDHAAATVEVVIPHAEEEGVGTHFNRAVVSSQAFSREFGLSPRGNLLLRAEDWLANGIQKALQDFIAGADDLVGAIYHLTDGRWVIPALAAFDKPCALIYDGNDVVDEKVHHPTPNAPAVAALGDHVKFFPREHTTKIMHDKFLVARAGDTPAAVLCGSANFTTEGLTSQANVIHTFKSKELAGLYQQRFDRLQTNPTVAATAKGAGWSNNVRVGDVDVRVFFPPEPAHERASIDTVVDAVVKARSSVLFCLFDPTDAALLSALFAAGDRKLMMFGLVNHVSDDEPAPSASGHQPPAYETEIFHRSMNNRDVVGHDFFSRRRHQPGGFLEEIPRLPGEAGFPVYIHHKFVVIDAETDKPIVYSGSANMSEGSTHKNDENLLELRSPRLAAIYLSEFMRLYEHYRARTSFDRWASGQHDTFKLAATSSWAAKYYHDGPEARARRAMAMPLPNRHR